MPFYCTMKNILYRKRAFTGYPTFFALISLFFTSLCGYTQPVASPDVKCINVALNGDVTLTWAIPPDPGGTFANYSIYVSTVSSLGPFSLAGVVNTYTQNSFTHTGTNANSQRVYYKVHTNYNPGPISSPATDTLSTIFLSVVNPGTGTAILNWNQIFLDKKNEGFYKIYREHPLGTWTLRDSTKNLNYTDLIDFCNDSISYKIEVDDSMGCTSTSNIAGGKFSDQTPPVNAPIDTVSVNGVGLAIITWKSSPSPDVDSVIIYHSLSPSGPWNPVLTVPATQTSAINPASKATTSTEYYRIAFKDSCSNLSAMGVIHKTIYLSHTFDICDTKVSLKWNKYINMNAPVIQYQILRSDNGSAFSLIATNSITDTSYTDASLSFNHSYCYIIKAFNGSKSSSSNKICFNAGVSKPPAYHYNRFATVISSSRIDLKAYVDPSSTSVKYYNILKAVNGSPNFTTIATLPPVTGTVLTYTDSDVNTNSKSYVYKINAMDSCGHVIISSNSDTTILLGGNIGPNLTINLNWNQYASWLGKVDHYEIYRAVDGVWNSSPVGTSTTNTYSDDVSAYLNSLGQFSYKVVAIEGSGNTYGFSDSSKSNIIIIEEYPKIYVPNAFTPNNDNLNDVFIPVIGFIDPSTYTIIIFDRTGTPVFTSNDPLIGWDGTKRKHPCQEGVYIYLIQCKSPLGNDSKISGTVSLIR